MVVRRKKLLATFAIMLGLVLLGVWYMNTRIYIDSAFQFQSEPPDQADVTDWVNAGGKIVHHVGIGAHYYTAVVVVRQNPPSVDNPETIALINKAMVRMGKMMLQSDDYAALEQFDARNHLKYLESWAVDGVGFVNTYVTEFISPSGKHIPLYPSINDNDVNPEVTGIRKGNLDRIWECHQAYAPCQDYVDDDRFNFDFLLDPKKY
jgi:hypothetical protein